MKNISFLFKRHLLLSSLLTLGVGLSSCTKNADTPSSSTGDILVGQYGSMTGSEATFGISTDKGVRLAIDEVNAKGGIKGRKIKLITLDNQGKSDESRQVVTRLIAQDKVVAVIGEVASGRSIAAAPVAQQYKIPMISPSSTNPDVTKIGNYIFRVCFIDPFQGYVMAKFMTADLALKKAAILRDVKSDYSMGLADAFTTELKKMGGEVVADVTYQAGDVDFKSQLTSIKSKNPDAIFIPGYYTDVGLIAQQARQSGIKAVFLGGDGWDSSKLSEIGKEAVNGSYFSNHYTTESTLPEVQEFIKKYKSVYNEVPDGLAAMGYDAALILIEAMQKAPEISPKAIRDELAKIKDFQAVTGKITINEERNAVKSAVVVQVNGKVNKFVTTVAPF